MSGFIDIEVLAKQSAISFLGRIANQVIGLIFVMLITRMVAPETYGLFTLSLSIIIIAQRLDLDVSHGVDYYIPQYIDSNELGKAKVVLIKILVIGSTFSFIGFIILFFASGYISSLLGEPGLKKSLPIIALAIPLLTVNKVLQTTFNAVKDLKLRLYTNDFLRPLTKLLMSVVLIATGWHLLGLVISYLISVLISVVVAFKLLLRNVDWITNDGWGEFSTIDLIKYTTPLAVSGGIWVIIDQMDYLLIGHFMTSQDVGFYRIAYVSTVTLSLVVTALGAVFKPLVAENKDDNSTLQLLYQKVARWSTMFTFLPALPLVLIPDLYLSLLFSAEYAAGGLSVIILSIGFMIKSFVGPFGRLVTGLGYSKISLLNHSLLLSMNFILNIFLIPQFGILGAAIGTSAAASFVSLFSVATVYYLKGIHPFSISQVKILASMLSTAVISVLLLEIFIKSVFLPFVLPLAVVGLFIINMVILNGFTEEDRQLASKTDHYIGTNLLEEIIKKGI